MSNKKRASLLSVKKISVITKYTITLHGLLVLFVEAIKMMTVPWKRKKVADLEVEVKEVIDFEAKEQSSGSVKNASTRKRPDPELELALQLVKYCRADKLTPPVKYSDATQPNMLRLKENSYKSQEEADEFFQQASSSSTPDEPPLYLHERDLTSDSRGLGDFKLGDIDVSLKFKNFMLVSARIARETGLLMESHPHHILALSNILLLKENQHPPHLLEQFSLNELKTIIKHFKNEFVPEYNDLEFSQGSFHAVKSVIKKLVSGDTSRGTAVKSLLELESQSNPDEHVILDILINCIKKLVPIDVTDPLGEIDLCITYLDPVLSPLLTDYDQDIYLRWPNLKSKETETSESNVNKKRRPDAVVSQLVQDRFQESRSFGEAKTKERKKDIYELTRDLIRIGIFSKESIDGSNIDTVMSFQAVGDSIRFYVTHLAVEKVYIMIEVAHITIPMSLSGLGDFLSKLDDLLLVKKCIDLAYRRPKRLPIASWKAQTLSSPNFKAYIHSSRSVKRATFIKF